MFSVLMLQKGRGGVDVLTKNKQYLVILKRICCFYVLFVTEAHRRSEALTAPGGWSERPLL